MIGRNWVLLLLLVHTAHSLTLNIVSGAEQCIWEEGETGDQLLSSFEVTKGDFKNLDVVIRDKERRELYAVHGKEEDEYRFNFDKKARIFLCFSSSKKDDISVSFRYQVGTTVAPLKKEQRSEFVTYNDMTNLAEKIQSLSTEIFAMQDEQRFTREKQHNYKSSLYKMKKRIIISSCFEAVVMLLCCLLQFFQFRNMIKY